MTDRYSGPFNPRQPIPDGESRISIYGYVPSLSLAIVALVTFAIAFFIHFFYFIRKKGFRTFQFLLCFGCAMELVGYGFRASSSRNPYVVIRFVIQYFMIVCAPVFFTAALYLSLSLAVRQANAPDILPIPPKALVTTFVIIDVVTTALQVLGAAFIGVSESARARGDSPFIETNAANDILLAGLAVQSFSFLVFLGILGWTWFKSHNSVSQKAYLQSKESGTVAVIKRLSNRFFVVLSISSLAVWLRTLFRLAETAEGVFGFASTHESLFGSLEYTPVIIALGLWAIFPLHKLLQTISKGASAEA